MPAEDALQVVALERLDFRLDPEPWAMATLRRAEIDAHYARLFEAKPTLWNGRILMLAEHRLEGATLVGRYKETDFASLLWWRDHGYPDPAMRNGFGMGALRGSDGGFILGRMAPWTANAGRIYFAAGTPDLDDLTPDGRVDIEGSVLREVGEEAGLAADVLDPSSGWTAIFAGPRIALMRELVAREPGEQVAGRIRGFLKAQPRPELDDVVIARGPDDLVSDMPDFIRAYLLARWQAIGNPP